MRMVTGLSSDRESVVGSVDSKGIISGPGDIAAGAKSPERSRHDSRSPLQRRIRRTISNLFAVHTIRLA